MVQYLWSSIGGRDMGMHTHTYACLCRLMEVLYSDGFSL